MKCKFKFKDDRICELCEISNSKEYELCKKTYDKKIEFHKRLNNIKCNCKFYDTSWDEYDEFDCCHKNGNGYGRFADGCKPTIACEKNKRKIIIRRNQK